MNTIYPFYQTLLHANSFMQLESSLALNKASRERLAIKWDLVMMLSVAIVYLDVFGMTTPRPRARPKIAVCCFVLSFEFQSLFGRIREQGRAKLGFAYSSGACIGVAQTKQNPILERDMSDAWLSMEGQYLYRSRLSQSQF